MNRHHLSPFRVICSLLFAGWILLFPFLGIALMESLHWDHRFGHPPVVFWSFCGGYLVAGLLLIRALRGRKAPGDDVVHRRPIALRVICTMLFLGWVVASPFLGIAFMLSLNWDRSFGHPPVAFWAFCAVYLVGGWPLYRGALPKMPRAQLEQSAD